MNTYSEMNKDIVKILRIDENNPVMMYAAKRIEELEQTEETLTGSIRGLVEDNIGLCRCCQRLEERVKELEDVLTKLDAYLDFGTPMKPYQETYFRDPSGINEVMALAKQLLEA